MSPDTVIRAEVQTTRGTIHIALSSHVRFIVIPVMMLLQNLVAYHYIILLYIMFYITPANDIQVLENKRPSLPLGK